MPPFERIESSDGKLGLVFPGQGSQFVGMGQALHEGSPAARRIIEQADSVLGFSLSRLAFEGPNEELEDTLNAQPAILTVSVAALEAVKERAQADGTSFDPAMVAGHSVGEFTALVAAGSLGFDEALTLVRERGRLMKEAGVQRPGGMAAVLGLDDALLEEVVAEARGDGILVVANANCPGQTVISGEIEPLARAVELAKERGAKRVVRLAISIASHSPLMADAGAQLREVVAGTAIRPPRMPIVANTGQVLTTADEIRQELNSHMESPVQWTRSVQAMVGSGVTTILEVGPGQALTGLIKRISGDVVTLRLEDLGLSAGKLV